MAQPVNVTVKLIMIDCCFNSLRGAADKTNIDVMKKALANFEAQTMIPGVPVYFVQFLQLELSIKMFEGLLPTK